MLKALYGGRCQICGLLIKAPSSDVHAATVHHFSPWSGDASDRLQNVICVCPNHHAMFELKSLRWDGSALTEWHEAKWVPRTLAVDKHLTTKLS